MNFEKQIKQIIASRGYGPWYQEQGWQTVRNWPLNLYYLFSYLDQRYPNIKQGE